MENSQKIIKSFSLKESLNPKIWTTPTNPDSSKLKDNIRLKLLEISNQFQEFIGLEIFVSDIHMTGSLSNFNWSEYSDVDLHLIVDFSQFSEKQKELYTELFKLKKTLFNLQHNIKIYNYDVELYVQDESEEHTSSGVYSVLFNEWIVTPKKEEFEVDKKTLINKVNSWMTKIDETIEQAKEEKDLSDSLEFLNKLRKKIKEYRSTGLSKGGEFSYENLVFKFLRRNGYIEKLFNFENDIIDKKLSLENFENIKKLLIESAFSFDPNGNYDDPTFGLPQGDVGSKMVNIGGDGGNWGGSMPRALAFAKVANDWWGTNLISSQKRSGSRTASGNRSDHWKGSNDSYGVDIYIPGWDTKAGSDKGDQLFNYLMDWCGKSEYKIEIGAEKNKQKWRNTTIDGYRYQFGWKTKDGDHNNHIHIGVRNTGVKSDPLDKTKISGDSESNITTDIVKDKIDDVSDKVKGKVGDAKDKIQQKINDLFSLPFLKLFKKSLSERIQNLIDKNIIPKKEISNGKDKINFSVVPIEEAMILLGYAPEDYRIRSRYSDTLIELIKKFEAENELSVDGILSISDLEVLKKRVEEKESKDEEDSKKSEDEKVTGDTKTKQSEIPIATSTDDDFYKKILEGLGAPVTSENMKFFYAWRQSEKGSAKNNPFATIYPLDKDKEMCLYNCINKSNKGVKPIDCKTCPDGTKPGVKSYSKPEYGIEATIKTLQSKKFDYSCITNGLKNNIGAKKISECPAMDRWGTGDLVGKVIDGYEKHGAEYKNPPIVRA